jgi:hypothetical protein
MTTASATPATTMTKCPSHDPPGPRNPLSVLPRTLPPALRLLPAIFSPTSTAPAHICSGLGLGLPNPPVMKYAHHQPEPALVQEFRRGPHFSESRTFPLLTQCLHSTLLEMIALPRPLAIQETAGLMSLQAQPPGYLSLLPTSNLRRWQLT